MNIITKRICRMTLKTIKWMLISLFVIGIIGATICYLFYRAKYKPFVDEIVDSMSASDFELQSNQTLYFANGEQMMMYAPYQKETLTSPSDITPVIRDVTLAAEDERFYKHGGVDIRSIIRALRSNISSDSTQGASTITQQLVKLSYLSNEKTYDRKIKEIFIALEVEKEFDKDEILMYYLNRVYFYNGVYGIADASQFYFSKPYTELTYDEAASLIAIINSPTKLDPIDNYSANQARKSRIIETLNRLDGTTLIASHQTEFNINDSYNDIYNYTEGTTGAISYVVHEIDSKQIADSEIHTSIDYDLQVKVESLVDSLNDPLQASVTVIDNNTGKVIAIDGSKTSEDEGSIYALNRAFQSPRQTGSSIKPLLDYSVIFDNYDIDTDFEVYDTGGKNIPKNSNGSHLGKITIKKAVTNSVNTIAFRLYSFMKDDGITPLSYLEKMNFSHLTDEDYNALAVSIGGFTYGATTLEMASGYATLANSGVYREPTALLNVNSEGSQVYSPIAAYLTTDALSEVATYGTAKKLNPKVPISCKTGTTNDNKDAWLCGYTRDYTIAVWVGADNNNVSYSVKSSGEVLDIFKSILEYLDPVDEEIYTEDEVNYIISHNNHPRRNSIELEEYFEDLMPAQAVQPEPVVDPTIQVIDGQGQVVEQQPAVPAPADPAPIEGGQ